MTIKRVCFVTGSRAEYDLLKPVMKAVEEIGHELRLIVAGMHLSEQFGSTYRHIEAAGFKIDSRVDMLFSRDDNAAMTKSIGVGIYGITQALESIAPDVVMVLGDRVEAFAAAVSGAALNKVLGHLHGGDRTKAGLDESMRHAISKLAHLHFAATEKSRERLIRMGEDPRYVYMVGAPGLDSVLNTPPYELSEVSTRLGFRVQPPFLLVVQHPLSTDPDSARDQMIETMEALKELAMQTILVYPNSDAGGRRMIEVIESYRDQSWLHVVKNLEHEVYLSLLRHAGSLVGNSSSGIIETPSLHVPVVNVGSRQSGRERGLNVIDVPSSRDAIERGIRRALDDEEFAKNVRAGVNPYGDGNAGKRVAKILLEVEASTQLLQKQLAY